MKHAVTRWVMAMLTFAILGAACGGDADEAPPTAAAPTSVPAATEASPTAEDSPSGPITFVTGDAHVELSGDNEETFDAPLDAGVENVYDPATAEFELRWRNDEGRALLLTGTFSPDGTTLDDAFVGIGAPGTSLFDEEFSPDAFHSQCTVEVSSFDGSAIEGDFQCAELERGDGTKVIDATETFSASA
jgi:hypothetical protein